MYDPVAECCVTACPSNTGLNVLVAPAVCVYCDASVGLVYNPADNNCTCISGYFLNPVLQSQCFPCQAPLCDVCQTANSVQCITCINGATFNPLNNSCSCSAGFYQVNNTCVACPASCATCLTGSSCLTCSDPTRIFASNCSCMIGYYDAGVAVCAKCSPSCATCNSSQTCLSCDARLFRTISGGACICANGYYELIYQNGSKTCLACSPECATCSISASSCTSCDSSINRIAGYDSLGHKTCICLDGYHALADYSCVQSNCTSDPFCSQCEQDLLLCVQCQANSNRVINLQSHVCVCANGYYADSNNVCQPCASGCAICTSLTNCTSCVATATPSSSVQGACNCPSTTYFTTSPSGVNYCSSCISYCSGCNNAVTCNTCINGFVLTTDGVCICPLQNYINPQGQCVPC